MRARKAQEKNVHMPRTHFLKASAYSFLHRRAKTQHTRSEGKYRVFHTSDTSPCFLQLGERVHYHIITKKLMSKISAAKIFKLLIFQCILDIDIDFIIWYNVYVVV